MKVWTVVSNCSPAAVFSSESLALDYEQNVVIPKPMYSSSVIYPCVIDEYAGWTLDEIGWVSVVVSVFPCDGRSISQFKIRREMMQCAPFDQRPAPRVVYGPVWDGPEWSFAVQSETESVEMFAVETFRKIAPLEVRRALACQGFALAEPGDRQRIAGGFYRTGVCVGRAPFASLVDVMRFSTDVTWKEGSD